MRRIGAVTLAAPLLLVGLWCVIWPVLDVLPFPGSDEQAFFELWLFGIPLTWAGLRLLRYGVRGPVKGGGEVGRT